MTSHHSSSNYQAATPKTHEMDALPAHAFPADAMDVDGEEHDPTGDIFSNFNGPASICRAYRHNRDGEPPILPPEFNWPDQKARYSPCRPQNGFSFSTKLGSKPGHVFCHRGFYDRSRGTLDNTAAAIDRGTEHSLFLHEVDVLLRPTFDTAFQAHELDLRRIIDTSDPSKNYSSSGILQQQHVLRAPNTDVERPDYASSFINANSYIPNLVYTMIRVWGDKAGSTLQVDLRERDFATAIAYYCFHMPKLKKRGGPNDELKWQQLRGLLKSGILKGYASAYPRFEDLIEGIRSNFWTYYTGDERFRVSQLHDLPPLIMVFPASSLLELAAKSVSDFRLLPHEQIYDHLYKTFMDQVLSFIRIPAETPRIAPYSFILEIIHTGLGLGYDRLGGEARNPKNGQLLTDDKVKFESLVDRVMIDVTLELKKEHPELRFSSCTRLPDVVTDIRTEDEVILDKKYKAAFRTSSMTPWFKDQEGLSSELRTIHGGLYPQSDMVVADDPLSEIAARTWVDEKSSLDRSKLLREPGQSVEEWQYYDRWLSMAGDPTIVAAVTNINQQVFLPNKYGGATTPPDGEGTASMRGYGWEEGNSSNVGSVYPGVHRFDDLVSVALGEDDIEPSYTTLNVGGQSISFQRGSEGFGVVRSEEALLRAAYSGRNDILGPILSSGHVDINCRFGHLGTALGAACAKGHEATVVLLLRAGADLLPTEPWDVPIQHAASHGRVSIVKILLSKWYETDPDTRPLGDVERWGEALGHALVAAARGGERGVVELLLEQRYMPVDFQDLNGMTALQMACQFESWGVFDMVLEHSRDDDAGSRPSALELACCTGNEHMIRSLLDRGAPVDFTLDEIRPIITSKLTAPRRWEEMRSRRYPPTAKNGASEAERASIIEQESFLSKVLPEIEAETTWRRRMSLKNRKATLGGAGSLKRRRPSKSPADEFRSGPWERYESASTDDCGCPICEVFNLVEA
jgi:hypothetical protein